MTSSLSRHSSLERNRVVNGLCGSTENIYRQRLDDAYYLRRMRDILQEGTQSRPVFPTQMTRLNECLFIGNQKNAEDLEELMASGVTHVVNCAPSKRRASFSDSPYPLESGIIGFKMIPAEDKEDYEIIKHFDDTLNYLDRVKQIKGAALVHCNMGVNRSGAIAAAYLMASEQRHLLDVITFLKEKRNIILTNKGFRRQLIKYARSKHLLDPISDDYYIRRSCDFERLPLSEQQYAFSTPQLRRCTAEQKPPRSRNKSGRSRTQNLDSPVNSFDQGDFFVKSLPRNITRNNFDQQPRRVPVSTSNPMTRRSISYMVKDLDFFDDELEKRTRASSYHASCSRKSIAFDNIILVPQSSPEAIRRHDDIPRLSSNIGAQYSSRYNLTISHPSNLENGKVEEAKLSASKQDKVQKEPSPIMVTSSSNLVDTNNASTYKNRYRKQIRQHFSGFINLIRPNINRNITSSQTSSPRSNQLTYTLPIQKSVTKTIDTDLAESTTESAQNLINGEAQRSYLSTNLAPYSSFQIENSVDNQPPQHFSTLNHVVRLRNQPAEEQTTSLCRGSLVLIGTRTVQSKSPTISNVTNKNQPATVPCRLRSYVRSKTDSELL